MENYVHLVQSTLSSTAHLSINKLSIKVIGLIPSILLADLISKAAYFTEKDKLDKDGFFFSEQTYIKEDLDLSEYHQKQATQKLVDLGILETKRVGIPPRIWFKIDYVTVFTNILNISDIKTKNLVYNNKNKDNKVSKDTKGKNSPVNKDLLFLLEEWRLKDTAPQKQKHPKEDSKQHAKIAMLTNLLLKGKFASHCDLDPKFLSSIKVTRKDANSKFTKDELLNGLDEMAEMFKQNNLPENKDAINKMDFAQLIYHPIAKVSYLLKYMYNPVKGLEYKTVQVYDHWLDKLYDEQIFDKDIENDNHQFGILKKGLAGIEEYYEWLYDNTLSEDWKLRNEDDLFNWYVKWLNARNSTADNPYTIGPQHNNWYKFIKWLEETIHGDHVSRYPTLDKRKYK